MLNPRLIPPATGPATDSDSDSYHPEHTGVRQRLPHTCTQTLTYTTAAGHWRQTLWVHGGRGGSPPPTVLSHPTNARLDWDLGSLEVRSKPWALLLRPFLNGICSVSGHIVLLRRGHQGVGGPIKRLGFYWLKKAPWTPGAEDFD